MKSLIYGYGKTGKSFESFLRNRNIDFDIFDINIEKFSKSYDYKKYSQIHCSPVIPRDVYNELTQITENALTELDIFFN